MASWTKEKAAAFLSESRWLAAQPADFRTALFAHGKLLKLAKGAIVYEQGEFPPKGFYGLLEGRLRASYHHADGETLLLWTMGPGAWVGEAALIEKVPRPLELAAATDAHLFFLPTAAFERMLETEPRHYRSFYLLTCAHLRVNFRHAVSARLDARARAARIFLRLVGAHGRDATDGILLDTDLSQSELAGLVGVSRQYINELLSAWQKEGVIGIEDGAIRVRAPKRLEALAGRAEAAL